MKNDDCLVFDVGGTTLRCGLYNAERDTLTAETSVPTPNSINMAGATADQVRTELFCEMKQLADRVFGGGTPPVVSIAFPGPINGQGQLLAAPTVVGKAGQASFALLDAVKQVWPRSSVMLINDVTAAGYRYLRHHDDDLCIVTVSSGIGHKIFVAGRPVVGPGGRGGEMGHFKIDLSDDALMCECGGRGHLGGIASGRGALEAARKRALVDPSSFASSYLGLKGIGVMSLDTYALVEAFHANDPWATGVVHYAADALARMLAVTHTLVGCERFVIFGGFALALGERYRVRLVETAADSCWNLGQIWNEMIELGINDDSSGLIGAGRYSINFKEQAF